VRCLGIVIGLAVWAASQMPILGGIEVKGDRLVVDTDKGCVTIERGTVVGMVNHLTKETYTTGKGNDELTAFLWHGRSARVGPGTKLTYERTGPNRVTGRFLFPDGHQLETTVAVDPTTQDIVLRQSGSTKSKGLYGIQWGIAGLDAVNTRAIVPGCSGLQLDPAGPRKCPFNDLRFVWPTGWEVQMMVVEGKRGGFSVWTEDAEMRFKALHWRRERRRMSLAFESHNYAPFDDLASVESVEWRIAFFKGDWRVPAKRYRDWMEKTWGLKRLEDQQPAWVKDVRFLVITGMQKDVLDALKDHVPPRATLLYIPGWRRDGYDKNYPDYTAHEDFGEFVRYAMGLGYHVMPHMNYFGCDLKHPLYERFKPWQLRNTFTKELMWWIPPLQRLKPEVEPTIKFAYIHPGSKAWRDELTHRLVEAQRKYGFDAIHLDQTIAIPNHAGGKVDGLHVPQGNVLLHKQIREAMPDVALSGEGLDEVTCRHEAFAQRHAANAVNHVWRTWNDDFIACGHPISSYFLTPYTRIYGYLGMSNPADRGLYLAWKRAYESWGIMPTYARPSAAQIESGNAIVRALLREARVWVEDALDPDFESKWGPDVKFRLKGQAGVAVVYKMDEAGGSRMLRIADGKAQLVYAFVKGRSSIEGTGSIAGWLAYDEKKIFGLNPQSTYVYVDEPRDLNVTHIVRAPEDAMIRVPMYDDKKMVVEFEGRPPEASHDFIREIYEAETGIIVDGRRGELDQGGSFISSMSNCGMVRKRCIFAHPPWRVKATGPEPARTFGSFSVDVPRDGRAFLEFSIGLRDGVNGRSDGVRFIVEVDGEAVFDEVWAKSEWKPVSVPLDKSRGKHVRIAFITTPGPGNNPSYDWACWGEPRIRLEAPPRRIVVRLASPKEVAQVLGPDPELKWRLVERKDKMWFYDVSLAMPGRAIFLWTSPRPVALPLDLAAEPFSMSMTVRGAPVKGPIKHVGAGRGKAKSNGVEKEGINAHPPHNGRTSLDYLFLLPDKKPITLAFAVGLRDGSKSDGVIFIVEANGRELYRRRVTGPDGWHPAEVDLSEFAGKVLLLSLVVDSDGPYYYDWATWAEPVLR